MRINSLKITYFLANLLGAILIITTLYSITETVVDIGGKATLEFLLSFFEAIIALILNIGFGILYVFYAGRLKKNLQSFGAEYIDSKPLVRARNSARIILILSVVLGILSLLIGTDNINLFIHLFIYLFLILNSSRVIRKINSEIKAPGSRKGELHDVLGAPKKVSSLVKRFFIIIFVAVLIVIVLGGIFSATNGGFERSTQSTQGQQYELNPDLMGVDHVFIDL